MADFTGAQDTAMMALLGGANVTEAAEASGCARETVSRWLNRNVAFKDELERRRAARWARWEQRIDEMATDALEGLSALQCGPEYHGGRDIYDARVRFDAIKLVLQLAGLLPFGAQAPAVAVQINNETTTSARAEPDAGRAPFREVNECEQT